MVFFFWGEGGLGGFHTTCQTLPNSNSGAIFLEVEESTDIPTPHLLILF